MSFTRQRLGHINITILAEQKRLSFIVAGDCFPVLCLCTVLPQPGAAIMTDVNPFKPISGAELLLRQLPLDIKSAAQDSLPEPSTASDEFIEVDVVVGVRFKRHTFTAGRAKGRIVWQAEDASIKAAGGNGLMV